MPVGRIGPPGFLRRAGLPQPYADGRRPEGLDVPATDIPDLPAIPVQHQVNAAARLVRTAQLPDDSRGRGFIH